MSRHSDRNVWRVPELVCGRYRWMGPGTPPTWLQSVMLQFLDLLDLVTGQDPGP